MDGGRGWVGFGQFCVFGMWECVWKMAGLSSLTWPSRIGLWGWVRLNTCWTSCWSHEHSYNSFTKSYAKIFGRFLLMFGNTSDQCSCSSPKECRTRIHLQHAICKKNRIYIIILHFPGALIARVDGNVQESYENCCMTFCEISYKLLYWHMFCTLKNLCAQVKPAITIHTQEAFPCMATWNTSAMYHYLEPSTISWISIPPSLPPYG